MSIQYALSQENLGKKHGLSDDDKPGDSTMAGNSGSPLPSSKIPLMKDKSSNEPNRIGFLNQCKLELSAEVIRWKEENHRLRKEKEISDQKICELQSLLDRFSRRNEELQASLLSSNQDYEKLKMHSLAIYEENRVLHRKLSKTCSKYYSYPWSEFGVAPVFPYLNGGAAQHPKADVGAAGSWEEVSQKLLEQMKLEMKELQELGQKLAINELPPNSSERRHSSSSVKDHVPQEQQNVCGNGVEDSITDLTHDFESLKQRLKSQHQKLTLLLSQTSLDCQNYAFPTDNVANHFQNNISADRKADSVISSLDWETTDAAEQKFVRPSDESFRAYFTQQLSNSKSAEELKRMMNFYLDGTKDFSDQSSNQSNVQKKEKACAFSSQSQPKDCRAVDVKNTLYRDSRNICPQEALAKPPTHKSQNAPKNCLAEEERVCPICEAVFPRVFSQKEFESHVVAHLEAESASLLDQYEIL